ncbi:MAG: hypothetical protein LBC38_02795 [Oscillospiraceae bacterium]|nr:hypothetical protein [Oscillospiraceae bacterium]
MKLYSSAHNGALRLDGDSVPNCMYCESTWYTAPVREPGLFKHKSGEVLVFIGTDTENPERLNAKITLQIENDVLTLEKTCSVFIPAGTAHGNLTVESLSKPVISYKWQPDSAYDAPDPAEAAALAGAYTNANTVAEGYVPPSGKLPEFPEGFLSLLLFLDSERQPGAPYMETMWMCTKNDTGPATHTHEDWDELIGFIGSDPDHPDELNATVTFLLGDETITLTKSTFIYVPRGVTHAPILVPSLSRPIIHFSQGNRGIYMKTTENADGGSITDNIY